MPRGRCAVELGSRRRNGHRCRGGGAALRHGRHGGRCRRGSLRCHAPRRVRRESATRLSSPIGRVLEVAVRDQHDEAEATLRQARERQATSAGCTLQQCGVHVGELRRTVSASMSSKMMCLFRRRCRRLARAGLLLEGEGSPSSIVDEGSRTMRMVALVGASASLEEGEKRGKNCTKLESRRGESHEIVSAPRPPLPWRQLAWRSAARTSMTRLVPSTCSTGLRWPS